MACRQPQANGELIGFNSPIPHIDLLGVRIHRVNMDAAMEAIRGFVRSGTPHLVVTADASSVAIAQRDEDFRRVVNEADLVTPDGSGVLLAAKWLGTPLICRVSGVDIARELCRAAAEEGFSMFLLGAAPGVAEVAAQKLKQQFPGLVVAGTHHGYFTQEQDGDVVSQICRSGAKALLVAMGIPRQEKWISAHLNELGVGVAIGVGGTLDVFSGRVKRAPAWMQRHGLEWAYRLATNPRKIRKAAALPRFVGLVLRARLTKALAADR